MTATIDTTSAKTFIVTGNYSEYLNWRKNNPSVKSCQYVERLEDLQGLNGFFTNIVLYGDYQNNPVYHTTKMQELLAERNSPFRSYVN
ncbi:hypothetical protein [Pseudanabaena mucicola]|uniref:Uncharacterized protein n=1 Tax=Pseudanabaena mucicola FACHB-723 TaxID=2692860 RepID=A0ABR7ZW76_9CYAN|nr:hypothetical protein [Pseudanabaena mucicola]MBD2188020.1 hypothetical protein [Pseudanabaena mucicola FACHB-723]